MTSILLLIPVALILGGLGLAAFLWSMRSGQFDDLDGAANRILFDDDEPREAGPEPRKDSPERRDGARDGGAPSSESAIVPNDQRERD